MEIANPNWDPKQSLAEFTEHLIRHRSDNNQTNCKRVSDLFDTWDVANWLCGADMTEHQYCGDDFYQQAQDVVTIWQQFNGVKPEISGRFRLYS